MAKWIGTASKTGIWALQVPLQFCRAISRREVLNRD
jgi:hypothetical protein